MSCPNCEALAEEVAYLKGELGASLADTARALLGETLGLSPKAVELLDYLYRAHGRVVPAYELRELFDVQTEDSTVVPVYVSKLRHALGKGAVLNTWGRGYRLSPEAVARVSEIVGVS